MTSNVKRAYPSIDYLTVTTSTDESSAGLLSSLMDEVGQEFLYHSRFHPWRFMGYTGRAYEGVRYGVNPQGAIVMLSGARANDLWRAVAPKRKRCTRVDLTVTCELVARDTDVAQRAYENALGNAGVNSSLITTSRGGGTCYVGSRQSQFFGRIYDKGAEEGFEAGWSWRYEVEIKKPKSEFMVTRLLEVDEVASFIADYVFSWFQSRAITPIFSATVIESAIEIGAEVRSDDKTLLWLSTQVKPTVQRLLIAGRELEVNEALGLPVKIEGLEDLKKEFEKWQ